MPIEDIHEGEALARDAAAIIALWLLIYGGDPPPKEVQVSPATGIMLSAAVAQLSAELGRGAPPLGEEELAARLARFGVTLHEERARSAQLQFGRLLCVHGPNGEPGCCVGLPIRIHFRE